MAKLTLILTDTDTDQLSLEWQPLAGWPVTTRYIYYGRYDETDFEDMVTTLRGIGAWRVDASPGYVSPF